LRKTIKSTLSLESNEVKAQLIFKLYGQNFEILKQKLAEVHVNIEADIIEPRSSLVGSLTKSANFFTVTKFFTKFAENVWIEIPLTLIINPGT